MKIIYDNKSDTYRIDLEYPEIELYVYADNVVELRERFIHAMTSLFDYTIRDSLKDSF